MFLMHCESTLLNRCSYVSHLKLFRICLSIKFLNFLGGFLKTFFNCVTVEQNARNYKNVLTQISKSA